MNYVAVGLMCLGFCVRVHAQETPAPLSLHAGTRAVARPNQVLVKGKQVRVLASEVAHEINRKPPLLREHYTDPVRLQALIHDLVADQLLLTEAKRKKLAQIPEVRKELDAFLAQLYLRRHLALIDAQPVTPEEIVAFYEQHKLDSYTRPGRVRILRVVQKREADAKRISKKISKISEKKLDSWAKKTSLQKELSVEGSDQGWIATDNTKIDLEVFQAAFSMTKPGQARVLRRDKDQYWVLYLKDRQETETLSLEKIRGAVESRIRYERRQAAKQKLLDELAKHDTIRFLPVEQSIQFQPQ